MRVARTISHAGQLENLILGALNEDERVIINFMGRMFEKATPAQIKAMADSIRIGEQKKQRKYEI